MGRVKNKVHSTLATGKSFSRVLFSLASKEQQCWRLFTSCFHRSHGSPYRILENLLWILWVRVDQWRCIFTFFVTVELIAWAAFQVASHETWGTQDCLPKKYSFFVSSLQYRMMRTGWTCCVEGQTVHENLWLFSWKTQHWCLIFLKWFSYYVDKGRRAHFGSLSVQQQACMAQRWLRSVWVRDFSLPFLYTLPSRASKS